MIMSEQISFFCLFCFVFCLFVFLEQRGKKQNKTNKQKYVCELFRYTIHNSPFYLPRTKTTNEIDYIMKQNEAQNACAEFCRERL